jgi:hypothetical protein
MKFPNPGIFSEFLRPAAAPRKLESTASLACRPILNFARIPIRRIARSSAVRALEASEVARNKAIAGPVS